MIISPSFRQRLLLFTAIEMYSKSAKACIGTLENLNLSTSQVETAQSRCEIAQATLEKEKEGQPVELKTPVVVTLRDCIALYFKGVEALRKKAEGLQAGTAEAEELQQELKDLFMDLADPDTRPLGEDEEDDQGDAFAQDKGGVDGNGTLPPKAENTRPLTGIPD